MDVPGFPFIGAGDASYFEWAEMFVCFQQAPTKQQAQAIAKRVPPPLRDTIEWSGPLLWVASPQGVGRLIAAAYGKAAKPPTELTTQSKFKAARASANDRFNRDIDDWLVFAHDKLPIRVAYRREDLESGGTRLSDWHHASVKHLVDVLGELADIDDVKVAALVQRLVAAANQAKLKINANIAKRAKRRIDQANRAAQAKRQAQREAEKAAADKALGASQPAYAKRRTLDELTKALDALAKVLPATARRLRRIAKDEGGLAVRPAATAAGIAAVENELDAKLTNAHRALLGAFDGGQIGDVVVLGTAKGGAKGDAEIAAFSNAWSGDNRLWTILAHTSRERVITLKRGTSAPTLILHGTPGWGSGTITRKCKQLDTALDLALSKRKVPSTRAGG